MPPPATSLPFSSCQRCATCCRRGGPALHGVDRPLLATGGSLSRSDLVTVRRGETAFDPASNRYQPVTRELLKINGRGGSWSCRFLVEESNSCAIYGGRPMECSLLMCWKPAPLLEAIGTDPLDRFDLLEPGSALAGLLHRHEAECSWPEVNQLIGQLGSDRGGHLLARLNQMVAADLSLRIEAENTHLLPRAHELFAFGRPLFLVLQAHGLRARERDGRVEVFV